MLGLSQVGITVAAFATQILLARSLPQAAFGTFTAALAVVSLTAPLAVFGVSELWLQRFGQEGERAYRWVRPSLRLVLIACVLLVAGTLVWSSAEMHDPAEGGVRALLASVVVAQAGLALVASVQQLRGAYAGLSALQAAPHLGRVLVVLAVWLFGLSVVVAAAGYALVALLTVVACAVVMRPFVRGDMPLEGHAGATGPPGPAVPVTGVARAATPFVLGNVFYLLGIYLGTVTVAEVRGPEAAAVLSVPMSVLTAVYLVPRVVFQQYFLAKLHRWSQTDRGAILMAYRYGGTGMFVLGVVIAALVALGGLPGLPFLLGPEYRESARVLAVLALAIPFRFAGSAVASLLTSGGLLRRKVAYQGVGALVFLVALAVATPLWGIMGAAAATVTAEIVLCVLFWTAVRRRVVGDADLPSWHDLRQRLTRGASRAS
ncbi:oligosaccharide flippase family protein [Micromonospora lupini]|uniref:oligosaccharide flippase family protein n=1 Tax=Micromonospora lupini TaxID=285679 RepID=UPI00225C2C33|nr:oligosaccharide flippase family protein [Micromonospora lupini]MCX5069544.1 oligosaccharide flippase family protein [Micromonospora lupini]